MHEAQDQFVASLGLPAFRVGGSVRDEVMGRPSKDADYVVVAPMGDLIGRIARAGKRCSHLQLRDGTMVGVRTGVEGQLIEICLPRREESTGPGHGDFAIVADPTIGIHADACRRDFTINALYKNVHTGEVVDPTGAGLADIRRRALVVLSDTSFQEDPLRCMRGFRFMSQLGFSFAPYTRQLLQAQAEHVTGLTRKGVSGTALDELKKLLMGDHPLDALRAMRDSGVMSALLPELHCMIGFEQESKYHDMTVDEHTFHAIQTAADIGAPLEVRLALLFHDSGKPESAWRGKDDRLHYYEPSDQLWLEVADFNGLQNAIITKDLLDRTKPRAHEVIGAEKADQALRRLGCGRRLREDVVRIVEAHMMKSISPKATKVRRLRARMGHDLARSLLLHIYCDAGGKGEGADSKGAAEKAWAMVELCDEAEREGVPCSVKDLSISGKDIVELTGRNPGAWIGEVQRQLLDEVACQPRLNDHEWLLARAVKIARPLLSGR